MTSTRAWRPGFPLDLAQVLRPLRRGAGDPAFRLDPSGAWLAATTDDGPGTLFLTRSSAEVQATAWGPGAGVLLDGVPALLGAEDDDSGFEPLHPVIAEARRSRPGIRLGATGRVWDVLLAAVLEQKVTGEEARRSWRELARRFGVPAPGPAPEGMSVPPTPVAVLGIQDWEWHKAGVDSARRRAITAAAQVAGRLEQAARLRGVDGRLFLRKVPGIGVWTAAEVAQRAWGDPDAVSVGDFHIPALVGYALAGRKTDDRGMLELLAPYAPHRQRVVRYIEASGFRKPRFGPRLSVKDYRGM
ncbi:DNA-3-methyladenine glycosylase family protein [Actinokineospora globicatena]|uniref:DNA-3-methyladenine glycosylase family protein n=1 Tax=Actinokineospora globicatena TaxID=103729 RepID=UPI0020A47B0E|nr:DNA-3-methyladenine glycosylase 2 family protein [Actinokineospora globicatena]MCP2302096.1 HhH-GPD superfamily base excision DNA repair protein [Actinokineospora globicatena]GLW76242.1 3-methyladenine DNA glycosylase [Actinokineospora globicatena]GLW83078.1 3-methyladenine DNA glycosylase [Actinokineospora globicatena]